MKKQREPWHPHRSVSRPTIHPLTYLREMRHDLIHIQHTFGQEVIWPDYYRRARATIQTLHEYTHQLLRMHMPPAFEVQVQNLDTLATELLLLFAAPSTEGHLTLIRQHLQKIVQVYKIVCS